MSKRRLPITRPQPGECIVVPYGRDERGFPVDALVVRDGDEVHAYLNVCKHIAIPLDAGSGEFLDEEGHLVCITHGALYRPGDGMCVAGPCIGEALDRVDVEDTKNGCFLLQDAESE